MRSGQETTSDATQPKSGSFGTWKPETRPSAAHSASSGERDSASSGPSGKAGLGFDAPQTKPSAQSYSKESAKPPPSSRGPKLFEWDYDYEGEQELQFFPVNLRTGSLVGQIREKSPVPPVQEVSEGAGGDTKKAGHPVDPVGEPLTP